MWQRFTKEDLCTVGHYLGLLILFSSVALLIPFITALCFQEYQPAAQYLKATGLALIVGNLMRFFKVHPGRLTRRQALAVTGLSWIVLALLASVPLYASGHYATFSDAIFDGVSGLTTTGASVVSDLDHLSNADNMFRFVMHYVGGLGLIVVALSIGLFGRRIDASLYSSEGRSEHIVPNIVQTTRFISLFSTVVILLATLLVFVVFLSIGMEPSRAFLHGFWLSLSGFMTGGFSPMADSIIVYHSTIVEIILMVLMLMGSVNFAVYLEVRKGFTQHFFKNTEIQTMVIWLVFMTIVLAASLSGSALFSDLPTMLTRGIFMIIAAATTTGFQNVTANQLTTAFTSGAFLVLAILMAVGMSAGSTTGGIKLRRIGLNTKAIMVTIKEALAPDSARVVVTYNHIGRHVLNSNVVRESMTVFSLFVVTIVTGALFGIAHGYEATSAIFESAAMTSNGGLTSGIIAPGMPLGLEIVYILQMWAGRLEFVTLLALIAELCVSIRPKGGFLSVFSRKRS